MTRVTWSGRELWIPDGWSQWNVENVRFRRAGGRIEIEVQRDDWQPVRSDLVEDGFAMPVGRVA